MRRLMIACAALFVAIAGYSQDVRVRLTLVPEAVLPGCPATPRIVIENQSAGPIQVPPDIMAPWFLRLSVPEGTPVVLEHPPSLDGAGAPWESLAAGRVRQYVLRNCYGPTVHKPGTYEVRVTFLDRSALINSDIPPKAVSAPIQFRCLELVDEDAEAYKVFKGNPLAHPAELLAKFPASTYAAYAVCEGMRHIFDGDREKFVRALELGSFLYSGSVLDDTGKSKDGWQSLGGKDLADWKAKWIDIVLKNHPDIWFADDIKLVKAADQISLKNYQNAQADLEVLSKQANPEAASKATWLLDVMKQKGWIKP